MRQYENKSLTIQSHIRSLLQTPKVQVPSAVELRNLHHHISSHVRALKALGQPVMHWDAWLVTLICSQLDSITAGEWQLRQDEKELPTYAQIESFLSKRVAAYEAGLISNKVTEEKVVRPKHNQYNSKALFSQSSEGKHKKCPACSGQHKIYSCERFNDMSIADRRNFVSKARLCFNCLNYGHQVAACLGSSCTKCGQRHNTRLHDNAPIASVPNSKSVTHDLSSSEQASSAQVLCVESVYSKATESQMSVMLATAVINIQDQAGQWCQCRAVLDAGSQMHFITYFLTKSLGLKLNSTSSSIIGVGSMTSAAQSACKTTVTSRFSDYTINTTFHLLPVIVQSLPSQPVNCNLSNIPPRIRQLLADPQFHVPGVVDVLLGADIFFDAFQQRKLPLSHCSSLIQTRFGWIVSGRLPFVTSGSTHSSLAVLEDSALALFTTHAKMSKAGVEDKAEHHFMTTYSHSPTGRFIVRLPLSQSPQVLGDSKLMARKRFFALEKRLASNPVMVDQYMTFMAEYLALGHMELADLSFQGPKYYLPHHAVLKTDSTTTKLRVVFDGSAPAFSGLSLNDIMLRGPKLQPDLINILWRFRLHSIAFTADVEKMYRQVAVNPDDCELQHILYRSSPEDPLKDYVLKTVTYGTKSASFLSIRCLVQIAHDCADTDQKRIILKDFYVDDLLSGGSTWETCYTMYKKLQATLGGHGFTLRKWCSSSTELMKHIPDTPSDPNFVVRLGEDGIVSTLGLSWQPMSDSFRFIVKHWQPSLHMTKRNLLSDINSIFDPIGLISPVLIKGKIFLQQLWVLKMGWDDPLTADLQLRWTSFYSSLQHLNQVVVPRNVILNSSTKVELHGFSDASQEAFGACIYVRSVADNGQVQVRLLTSKSKVASLRATTIPRLELCGAVLAAELIHDVLGELRMLNIIVKPSDVHLWTDSLIVLAWIKSANLFQSYVANRIARIRDVSSQNQWKHVSSIDNPADLISRGVNSVDISTSTLWWEGPPWLIAVKNNWPSYETTVDELPEVRKVKLVLTSISDVINPILEKFSHWMPLIRITGWLLRFIHNAKIPSHIDGRSSGPLTVRELHAAQMTWVKFAQRSEFACEYRELSERSCVSGKSKLKTLHPFIDERGLIRVGGRLGRSSLPHHQQHPLFIPSKHKITQLIFRHEHERLLHAGPQSLLAHIHRSYWPLRGKAIATKTVHKCIVCFRFNPSLETPFMAPLPRERVVVSRAFSRSGVDFCGPLFIKSGLRRVVSIKCYVSVFVCFATRAIHLELVSDLSTQTFLAALDRFMARRGLCAHIHSDNGTHFVGAAKVLKNFFKNSQGAQTVVDVLANQGIQWHFIPPAAPHFGGLWKAAVKSAKHHLLKVTKGVLLNFEEMNTLLCKIEAVLNSRPLTAMSSDPSDFQALTSSHFLIGGPTILPEEPDVSSLPINRLRRFELVRSKFQTFWKRWHLEYLPQLQRRNRWTSIGQSIKLNDILILKEENLPPYQWKLCRVTAVHPGSDGIVRVVTVKLSSGIELRRPVAKVALLPLADEEDHSI